MSLKCLDEYRSRVLDYVSGKETVIERSQHIPMIPLSIITMAVSIIVGVGFGIKAALARGRDKETVDLARGYLDLSGLCLAAPYLGLLGIVDPKVHSLHQSRFHSSPPWINLTNDCGNMLSGFFTYHVGQKLTDIARDCLSSDNYLNRKVGSRLTFAISAIVLVITRVVDGIIGIVAAGLSLVTRGRYCSLNNLAIRGLQFPGVLGDLFICTLRVFNPWAGVDSSQMQDSVVVEKNADEAMGNAETVGC